MPFNTFFFSYDSLEACFRYDFFYSATFLLLFLPDFLLLLDEDLLFLDVEFLSCLDLEAELDFLLDFLEDRFFLELSK